MLTLLVSLIAGQPTSAFVSNAKLGTPYLLGYATVVSGSKEVIDTGTQRIFTLNSVRTALSFAAKGETFVAGAGQKLVLLSCTLKNPSTVVSHLGPGDTYGIRVFDTGAVKGDYHVAGAVSASLAPLHQDLKRGESADVITILQAPARVSTLRLGFYYQQQGLKNLRRYDLTSSVPKPNSVFSTDGLVYSDTAEVKIGQSFELDSLEAKVLGFRALPGENQLAVDVQVTNRTMLPAKWGWQYATANLLTNGGESIPYYSDFFDKATGKSWSGDVPAGATVNGEYRFNPGKPISATEFVLKTTSTKRTVIVHL